VIVCYLAGCVGGFDGVGARIWYAGFRSLKHGLWDADGIKSRTSTARLWFGFGICVMLTPGNEVLSSAFSAC
jgi:hypothetical protein